MLKKFAFYMKSIAPFIIGIAIALYVALYQNSMALIYVMVGIITLIVYNKIFPKVVIPRKSKKAKAKKRLMNVGTMKVVRLMSIFAVISVSLVILTFNYFIEFSSFAVILLKITIGFTLFWLIDKFAMDEIDTMEEIKKGNISYGLLLLGLSITIAAAVIAS